MALYDRTAATVLRLLTKYGQSVTLRKYSQVSGGDYDPNTGGASPVGADGSYDESRKAIAMDQPGSQIAARFGTKYDKNTLIQSGEKWVYMDANGSAPALQDHVLLGGTEYSIMDVQVTGPGGIPVLYLLVLKN
jgi:hypothetical protein